MSLPKTEREDRQEQTGTFRGDAQDKIVVVPLGSGGKPGGTDKQVQYNDSGSLAGAEVYYDNTTGYVGVGTASPTSHLEISGENSRVIYFSSAYASGDPVYSPMFIGRRARGFSQAPEAVLQGDLLTYVGAKGYDGVSWDFLTTGGIGFVATENHDASSKGTGIRFMTTADGTTTTTPKMVIGPGGNVGIGTMNPLSKLAVSGLPLAPPADGSTLSAMVCVTDNGNFWVDADGTPNCQVD